MGMFLLIDDTDERGHTGINPDGQKVSLDHSNVYESRYKAEQIQRKFGGKIRDFDDIFPLELDHYDD